MKKLKLINSLMIGFAVVLIVLLFSGFSETPVVREVKANPVTGLSMNITDNCCVCEILGGVCEVSDQCCVEWGDCDHPNCGL